MAIVNHQLITTQLDALTVPAGKRYAITNYYYPSNLLNKYTENFPKRLTKKLKN